MPLRLKGWKAEYCTEQRGPTNCVTGVKDDSNGIGFMRPMTRRRKGTQEQAYLPSGASVSEPIKAIDEYTFPVN